LIENGSNMHDQMSKYKNTLCIFYLSLSLYVTFYIWTNCKWELLWEFVF